MVLLGRLLSICQSPGFSNVEGSSMSSKRQQEEVNYLLSLSAEELGQHGDIPALLVDIANGRYTREALRSLYLATGAQESASIPFYAQLDVLELLNLVGRDHMDVYFPRQFNDDCGPVPGFATHDVESPILSWVI